ncbi:hypothetical protein CJ030_MR1G022640 [Morella rubra]|uniref:Uncharacterized protein n=1 Tax=Morella rubra TaxID=262757 RepID=A0A6A1WX35_9ROSI|nr:hypothetical protein CJ030_MR1G022640 [Morella rubra]
MTRKRFRTISSSSQPPVPPSQEATASQEATPSQPPTHPSEQATMPSSDYDQSLNDNEIIVGHGVKHPHIQAKLFAEISGVVGHGAEEVNPYIQAKLFAEISGVLGHGGKRLRRNDLHKEKEKQVPINRADLYKTVHMRSDGSPINPDVVEKIEQRQYQDVANNNHVSPAIHRSSHASRKTSVDNANDAESVGADGADEGAEGGED